MPLTALPISGRADMNCSPPVLHLNRFHGTLRPRLRPHSEWQHHHHKQDQRQQFAPQNIPGPIAKQIQQGGRIWFVSQVHKIGIQHKIHGDDEH